MRLADRRPAAVGVAAGDAAGLLWASLSVDRVHVFAAALVPGLRIGRSGDDGAVGAVVAAPADGGAGTAVFERLHLGHICAAAILGVERVTDRAPDDTADHRAGNRGTRPAPGAGTDQGAGERAGGDTRTGLGTALVGTGHERAGERHDSDRIL